jgi:hypothetical protein
MSKRYLCGILLVFVTGGANVFRGEHKYEGKIIGRPGLPPALVYRGKLIQLQNPNLVYCLATENVTVSMAEYEAIPVLGGIHTGVPLISCIDDKTKPGCLLGRGVDGKVARFALDRPELAAANQSPGCSLADSAYASIPHLADLFLKRKLPEPPQVPDKVRQWEYKIYRPTDADFVNGQAEAAFNKLAAEGWEFVETIVSRAPLPQNLAGQPDRSLQATTCVLFKRVKK